MTIDITDVFEKLKKAVYKIFISKIPVYGELQIVSQELAPLFIEGVKESLDKSTTEWQKNLELWNLGQLESERDLLVSRNQMLDEELENYSNFDGAWGAIVKEVLSLTHQQTKLRIKEIDVRLNILKGLTEATEKITSGKPRNGGKKTDVKPHTAELPPIDVWGKMPTPEYAPTTEPKSLFDGGSTGWGTISHVPLKDLKKLQGANKEQMEEMSKEMQAFVSAFDSGMQAVGQGINQWIGGAFRRSFGEANSLLEIFFLNFSNQLAQIGIQAGIGALFGALGIPVPSGKIGSLPVPSGPFSNSPIMEQATNINLRNASSQGLQNMQLTTKISGSDLYIVLEKGKSNLLGRSLR